MFKNGKLFGIFDLRGFKSAIPWISLGAGGLCLYLGYFYELDDSRFSLLYQGIANILIVGVLVGFITSSAQFFGVFKDELEKIIYDSKFLNKRSDISNIWINVSKALFKSKFPEVSKELLDVIKGQYLPLNDVSYYSDYETRTTIDWYNKEKRIIEVVTDREFKLIAYCRDKFNFSLSGSINIEGLNDAEYLSTVTDYRVNNKAAKVVKDNTSCNDNIFSHKVEIELKGELEYNITKKITKRYCLDKDYFIAFKAKYIIKNFRLQVFNKISNDLELNFIERGVLNEFKNIKKDKDYLEKQYKGLILPKQGYVLIMKEKRLNI